MNLAGNYVGRQIYIRDGAGNDLASSTVLEHNKEYMTIVVGAMLRNWVTAMVTVLIVMDEGIHEYRGTLHSTSIASTGTEIALFQGRLREDRSASRYATNIPVLVERLVVEGLPVPLLTPVKAFMLNLSVSGALLRAATNCFDLNSVIELKLNIGGKMTALHGKMIWTRTVSESTSEYGCEFIVLASPRKEGSA